MAKLPGKKIEADLTWDAVAKKYLEMFEEAILLRAGAAPASDDSAYLCAWFHLRLRFLRSRLGKNECCLRKLEYPGNYLANRKK